MGFNSGFKGLTNNHSLSLFEKEEKYALAVLRCHEAQSGSCVPTFWDSISVPNVSNKPSNLRRATHRKRRPKLYSVGILDPSMGLTYSRFSKFGALYM